MAMNEIKFVVDSQRFAGLFDEVADLLVSGRDYQGLLPELQSMLDHGTAFYQVRTDIDGPDVDGHKLITLIVEPTPRLLNLIASVRAIMRLQRGEFAR